MFEFDKYEKSLHRSEPAMPRHEYVPVREIAAMSFLVWGEHCIECAAPACFSTCDLYQRRPDERCRRFSFGAYKNRNFDSCRGYGTEVSFKRWAKVEARGNATMWPVRSVLQCERLMEALSPVCSGAGYLLNKITRDVRWKYLTHALLERFGRHLNRRRRATFKPDAFLLELYNPSHDTALLQVSMTLSKEERLRHGAIKQVVPAFAATVSVPYGYSRHEFEFRRLQSVVDSGRAFDIALAPEADTGTRLVFLTADFVTYANRPDADKELKDIKCVVWDVDNTLWKGTLVEGDDVQLNPHAAELLKYFDDRGILLSVASKNNHEPVLEKLTEFGIEEYFLYPQINWMPKSQNIKTIAEQLNIGLDTFAFIDDNPFELDEVSRVLPQVTCINAADTGRLTAHPRFQGSTSPEARNRRRFYQEAITRENAQASFGGDYFAFLGSCGINLEVAAYMPDDLDRAGELVQRTNQLNFSGRKYSRSQLFEILENPSLEKYVLKCNDNYGSYGTVGFSIVEPRPGIILIQDFMLSCRVQGKFLEQAFFHHLVQHHNPFAASVLWVNFLETSRNKPAKNVLESLQFRPADPARGEPADGMLLECVDSLLCTFIDVHCRSASAGSGNQSHLIQLEQHQGAPGRP